MKHTFCVALLVALGLSNGVHPAAQGAPRVLLFIRDGSGDLELMLTKEVGVMKTLMEQAGIKVDVATISGAPLSAGRASLTPDFKLADVDIARYAGVILPCMGAGALISPESVQLVERAAAGGKPIAAQTNSILALAAAGVLVNRNYAFAVKPTTIDAAKLSGSTYRGDGVVADGSIITSGVCPMTARNRKVEVDGTAQLAREFIKAVERRGK